MDGTLAEIRLFAGNFAPRDWAFCSGQLIAISQNQALFALLGIQYGGDGHTTFALPDLRSRVPVGSGNGPGLSNYRSGQIGGHESVMLSAAQMPAHTHEAQANASSALSGSVDVKIPVNTGEGEEASPASGFLAPISSGTLYAEEKTANQYAGALEVTNNLNVATNVDVQLEQAGGSAPVSNVQPYLGMNYIICTNGLFPSHP